MTGDMPPREGREAAADAVRPAGAMRPEAEAGELGEGGDPACWASLVCQECGAMIGSGHREGCSCLADPAGP